MALTAAQIARQRARARRDLELDYRAKARAKITSLREQLQRARKERARKLKKARAVCKAAKSRVRKTAPEIRRRHRDAAAAEIAALRTEAATTCETRRARAARKAADSIRRATKVLDAEKLYQGEIRRASKRKGAPRAVAARAAVERARESDDEVAGNLPPELLPVWTARASKTRPTERATRTEVFLQWAHDHSADVDRIVSRDLDRQIAELARAERRERAALKGPTRAELRHAYDPAATPF